MLCTIKFKYVTKIVTKVSVLWGDCSSRGTASHLLTGTLVVWLPAASVSVPKRPWAKYWTKLLFVGVCIKHCVIEKCYIITARFTVLNLYFPPLKNKKKCLNFQSLRQNVYWTKWLYFMFTSHIRKIKNTTDNKSNILNLLELISLTIYTIWIKLQ